MKWIFTLFATEEIPSAMTTFVALLMFMQMGVSPAVATLLSALLFLPWVSKSWMRSYVFRLGHYRRTLHLLETALSLSLAALAFALQHSLGWTFATLMLVSLLSAGHELTSHFYYERMLRPRLQRFFNGPKMLAQQMAVIMTYGMMITAVGVLQIYFRRYSPMLSWSMGCYVASGIMLMFTLWHTATLKTTHVKSSFRSNTVSGSFKAEMQIIARIKAQALWWKHVLTVVLILLPQSLMFFTRAVFFLSHGDEGGLSCTLQEIGFVQGTVGVIAFWIGISGGRWLLHNAKVPEDKLFWPLTFVLGLSPLVYFFLTIEMPHSLLSLCMAAFQAQLLFGLGLNACHRAVKSISGERHRNTVNLLYIPLVSASMLVPMAASGWLCTILGFRTFFLFDTLTAPISWLIVWLLWHTKTPETQVCPQ